MPAPAAGRLAKGVVLALATFPNLASLLSAMPLSLNNLVANWRPAWIIVLFATVQLQGESCGSLATWPLVLMLFVMPALHSLVWLIGGQRQK
jgi:hypothetical protein